MGARGHGVSIADVAGHGWEIRGSEWSIGKPAPGNKVFIVPLPRITADMWGCSAPGGAQACGRKLVKAVNVSRIAKVVAEVDDTDE